MSRRQKILRLTQAEFQALITEHPLIRPNSSIEAIVQNPYSHSVDILLSNPAYPILPDLAVPEVMTTGEPASPADWAMPDSSAKPE